MTPPLPWFDRQEILELLSRRVTGFEAGYRQNLALLGPDGMGKTTLLKRFLQGGQAGAPGQVRVYLDVVEEDSLLEWVTRFVQAFLYAIVLQVEPVEPLPTRLAELLSSCSSHVPRTAAEAARVLALAESGKSEEAYDRLWDLPQLLFQETGTRTVLILDEFHRLALLPVRDSFRALGRKIMVQNATMYILASSNLPQARAILREGLALLFGQFETVEMGPLTEAACRSAIQRMGLSGEWDAPTLEYLVMQLAQGNPERLDLILRYLKQVPPERLRSDPMGAVLELLEALLLDAESRLRKRFEARLRRLPAHRSRLFCLHVLEKVAFGVHRRGALVETLGRSTSQVRQALSVLEDRGLVERHGAFFQVPDQLFRLWMVCVHPLLHGVGLGEWSQWTAHFREAASAWLQQSLKAVRLPLRDRVLELIRAWGNDHVEIEGRRILLPGFSEVSHTQALTPCGALLARRPKGNAQGGWAVLLWEGPLEEKAARGLVEELRKHPAIRGYRRVLVGPASAVEVNVRLILQQGKIRLWDLQILNRLLDLYGLPCAWIGLPLASRGGDDTVTPPLPAVPPLAGHAINDGHETDVSWPEVVG